MGRWRWWRRRGRRGRRRTSRRGRRKGHCHMPSLKFHNVCLLSFPPISSTCPTGTNQPVIFSNGLFSRFVFLVGLQELCL